jgi:hypothetical protein
VQRNALWNELHAEPLTFTGIEALAPSRTGPLRVGVAPPVRDTGSGSAELDAWTDAEREVLEEWGAELVARGVFVELVLLPGLLVDNAPRGQAPAIDVVSMRRAAARRRLDAVVVVRGADAFGGRQNVLGLLNLTIVGLWLAPGHSFEGVAALEAVVVDARTGYVFAAATAEGEHRRTRPYMYGNRRIFVERARLAALGELGARLTAQLAHE